MRSIGTHRGNPVVRSMIQQAVRRRLYANLAPHQGESDASRDPEALRWSRGFFEHLRNVMLPRLAPVASLEEGELRYFGGAEVNLWALVAPHALVVAYDHHDSPSQIRERARRWRACLKTRTAPGLASPHWGHPVYGARLDPRTDELEVVWATLGGWFEFAQDREGPARAHDLPAHWAESSLASA